MERDTIIRVSSFCYRRKYHDPNKVIDDNQICDDDDRVIQVSLIILRNHPWKYHYSKRSKRTCESSSSICERNNNAHSIHQQRRRKLHRKTDCTDEFSSVYVDSPDFLVSLEVFEDQLCKLVLKSENNTSPVRWVPVFLKVLPKSFVAKVKSTPCVQQATTLCPTIYVPPCIAASLDICHPFSSNIHHDHSCLFVSPLLDSLYTNLIHKNVRGKTFLLDKDDITAAKKAVIREIGVPPSDFVPSFGFSTSHPSKWRSKTVDSVIRSDRLQKDGHQNQKQLDNLKQYFFDHEKKPKKRLMRLGSIFSIVDISNNSNHPTVRHYELVQADQYDIAHRSLHETNTDENYIYYLSSGTELILTSRNQAKCYPPRALPQYSLSVDFNNSIFGQSISDAMMTSLDSHHCLDMMIKAIYVRGRRKNITSSGIQLEDHIIHIIGQKDDHINECLEAAADIGKS